MIDTTDFRRYLSKAEAGLVEAAKSSVRRAAVLAWQTAHETSLYRDRTGKLRQRTVLEDGRNEFTASLIARTPYAAFVNAGTRPHVIFASKAPVLRFKVGGQWRSALAVHHPGTSPRPFMTIAAKTGEQALIAILDAEAKRATL